MLVKGLLRKDNPFDYIVLGFIMKLLGNVMGFFISYHIADSVFGLLSWWFIIQGYAKIPGKLKFPFTGFYNLLLSFFLLQCFVMIVRGYLIDYNYVWFTTIGAINYHLFEPTYILCYLMPFIALIPIRYYNFRLVINYSIIFVGITVVLAIIYRDDIMQSSALAILKLTEDNMISASSIIFCSSFTVLTLLYRYLPLRHWQINMVGLITILLLVVVGARRGGIALTAMMLVGALYFRAEAKSKGTRVFAIILSAIMVVVLAYYILQSAMASFLMERGLEDTRSYVEVAMFDQMDTMEYIFGKGLNGRYYCPLRDDDYLNGWRYGIETGFYNMVLKGGYLLAITYVILLAIPAYKGIFKSRNLFCKAGGFFIVYNIVSLWPFGILQFSLSFVFLWIMIVCCMNNYVLKMSDEDIKKQFFYNLK